MKMSCREPHGQYDLAVRNLHPAPGNTMLAVKDFFGIELNVQTENSCINRRFWFAVSFLLVFFISASAYAQDEPIRPGPVTGGTGPAALSAA